MNLHDAWTSLRHGGNLLSSTALTSLPAAPAPAWNLADRLRTALAGISSDNPTSETVSFLLDTILVDACGLRDGWRKGHQITAVDAEKLLDGTPFKPRRILSCRDRDVLAVFVTPVPRIGLGTGRRPVAHAIEYLRRRRQNLGIVTNGAQWRLIWADQDNLAWVEWDAERWLDADRVSDELHVLRYVLSPSALGLDGTVTVPLLDAIRDTRRGQAVLSRELGERVRNAVETLLKSRNSVIEQAWNQHGASDLYVAASHFIMRMVVILFAEARELLPVDNPVYHQAYGLRGLIEQLDRITAERRRSRRMAWPRLLSLFKLLYHGSPHPALNLPVYGGDLFRPGVPDGDGVQRALALLESPQDQPDDDTVYRLLVLLTRTTQKLRDGAGYRTVAAPVDFTELTSEYIGILYEGLLDYELRRAGDEPVIFLNLGDQPALPLDRLEAMDDKGLLELVKKAKVTKKVSVEEGDADEEQEDAIEDDEISDDDDTAGPDGIPSVAEPDNPVNDPCGAARARAHAWARRLAVAGKLVKRPRGKNGATDAAYQAALDAAARQLVASIRLPGELFLVRWGGTRKGAGTFYTRPQLTLPTVRRTLEPLVQDESGQVPIPEHLLSLKVCDPAMGSGSFLVAALRILTARVVESLHVHGRIEKVNGTTFVNCQLIPEADRHIPSEGFDERLESVVRRAVVENCLYGVDLDPLAVELARVALWVETLDRRLPFTFLDHKLRCGNSLIGTWLDRFRDYPLLCFDRESPDKKYSGVNHPADVWHKKLKEKRSAAALEQAELLSGQYRIGAKTISDADIGVAIDRVRRLYRELRAVPAGRPDERARIWRERIMSDYAFSMVRDAFDVWTALWFWPLDKLDLIPMPSNLSTPSQEALAIARDVCGNKRFIHWELEFPDVFTEEGAGFDAVIGNPPWEIQKPNSREFFSNHDPLYRTYGKQEAVSTQHRLFTTNPEIEDEWLAYLCDFKDRGNFVRNSAEPFGDGTVAQHAGGDISLSQRKDNIGLHRAWRSARSRYHGTSDPMHPFRHQGGADLNTYKMFVETGHGLLRRGGQMGMIVPSGLYTDQGSSELRRTLLAECDWRWLYSFENRNRIFDIHRSFKFCVLIATKGGQTSAIRSAFMRHDLEDWATAMGVLDYPVERVRAFSPKSLSLLEIRTERDLEVLSRIYANSVLLGDDGPDGWGIQYAREFDMTNDSKLFIARDKAEADGFRPDIYGRWKNDSGDVLLPLYEGRMIGQFDFSQKGWVSGKGRSAVWREIPWDDKKIEPQFLLHVKDVVDPAYRTDLKIGQMRVTSATNCRTLISSLVTLHPCGDKVATLRFATPTTIILAPGVLNSFVFDYALRNRVGGLQVDQHILVASPVPILDFKTKLFAELVGRLVLNKEFYSREWLSLSPRRDIPWRQLWAVTQHERLRIRSILDAVICHLYGLNRDGFIWILKDCDHTNGNLAQKEFCRQLDTKGFWRVDKTEEPVLRHTVLSVAAFDDLQKCIALAGGDRDAGIEAFCNQNDGDGWMLPETLCIADLGMTRTVDIGVYDESARTPQPVRSRMGPRFLDWQLAQTPEESWAECERHAKAIMEGLPTVSPEQPLKKNVEKRVVQDDLFAELE